MSLMNKTMNISFDDFTKLDIRIGTILTIEEVPDADKLLKLTVDLGEEEPRQIVSGIKQFYDDFTVLEGCQAPFVVNLESRTIRGLESQGMIMAVGDNEDFTILSPQKKVEPGTPVR